MEYKIHAVKPAKEPGSAKTAAESGIPENTMYAWTKAAGEGRLDAGPGSHTPRTAMSLAEELALLRRQVKAQGKEIRHLKEENEFLEEQYLTVLRSMRYNVTRHKMEIRATKRKKSVQ